MRSSLPIICLSLALCASPALAQGFPRTGVDSIENGKSAPFVGEWSMGFPEDYTATAATILVPCETPVVIEAADDTHIRYMGPNAGGVDPAIELSAVAQRTHWVPIAGGASYVIVWHSADAFFLYEMGAVGEADWSGPLLYNRCS